MIQINNSHPRRRGAHTERLRGLESPVTVAQQNRNRVASLSAGTKVGYRQIRLAVTVEIAHRYKERTDARRESLRRLERPIAVP